MKQFYLFTLSILFTFSCTFSYSQCPSSIISCGSNIWDTGQSLGSDQATNVALGDIDGDGDFDALVSVGGLGTVPNKVYLNDGNGNFSNSGQSLGNNSSYGISLGDLDGDGDLDAFFSNGVNDLSRTYINNSGIFTTNGFTYGSGVSTDAGLGDFDNDGDLDLFLCEGLSTSNNPNFVYLNNGSGQFINTNQTLGVSNSQAVGLGDFDGDGDLDAFVANRDQADIIYLNDGFGTFVSNGQSLGMDNSSSVDVGDLDGDGDLDAVVSIGQNAGNKVYLNDGSGNFTDSGQLLGLNWTLDVDLGDIDQDGDLDALFTNNGETETVYINDGYGVFSDAGYSLNLFDGRGAALADLDGDLDLDAFIVNWVDPARVYFNGNTCGDVCQFGTESYHTTFNPNATFQWNVIGGQPTAGINPNEIDVLWDSTFGSIEVIVTDSITGCLDTSILVANVLPAPPDSLSGNLFPCEFECQTYSTPLDPLNNYMWSVVGGAVTIGINPAGIEVCWGGSGAGNILLDIIGSNGCSVSIDEAVTIQSATVDSLSGNLLPCESECSLYSTLYDSSFIYNWAITGGTMTPGINPAEVEICWGGSGTADITLDISGVNVCTTTINETVTIESAPADSFLGNLLPCEFECLNYSTPFVPGYVYVWAITGGTMTPGTNPSEAEICWGGNGTGTLNLDVISPNGCQMTISDTFMIQTAPENSFSGFLVPCEFECLSYSTPFDSSYIYDWSVSGGTLSPGNNAAEVEICWGMNGSGHITLKIIGSNGCVTTIEAPVTIMPALEVEMIGPEASCINECGHVYEATYDTTMIYDWDVVGGTFTQGMNEAIIEVCWDVPGTGIVTLNQGWLNGDCEKVATLEVEVTENPTASISGPESVCINSCGISYSSPFHPNSIYSWHIEGGHIDLNPPIINPNEVHFCWSATDSGYISLEILDTLSGCSSVDTLQVFITTLDSVSISGIETVCTGICPYVYTATQYASLNYSWEVVGGTILGVDDSYFVEICWDSIGLGELTVTLMTADSLCDTSGHFQVNILGEPEPILSGLDSVEELTLNVPYSVSALPGSTVSWFVTGGSANSSGNTVFVDWGGATTGEVCAIVTDSLSCDSTVCMEIVVYPYVPPIGIGDEFENYFNLYPNPFTNSVFVEFQNNFTSEYVDIKLMDLSGKIKREWSEIHSGTKGIQLNELESLSEGVYFIQITSENRTFSGKLIK